MPFTGFYQPLPELRPITPTVNPLQQEFHKMAQDFIANTQKQQQLNIAEKEQQVAQFNAQTQRQAAIAKAKVEKQKAQEDIREREAEAKVQRAVLAAKEAIPDMSDYDSQIMAADMMAGFGYSKPLSEVRKHFSEQAEIHRKTKDLEGYNKIKMALKERPLTREEFNAIVDVEKPIELGGALISPSTYQQVGKEATDAIQAQNKQKELDLIAAREKSAIARKAAPSGRARAGSGVSGGTAPVAPSFMDEYKRITGETIEAPVDTAPAEPVSEAPMQAFPAGTGGGGGGVGGGEAGTIGFGVDPSAISPAAPSAPPAAAKSQGLKGQELINALIEMRALAKTKQENKILDDRIKLELKNLTQEGREEMVSGRLFDEETLDRKAMDDIAGVEIKLARGDPNRARLENRVTQLMKKYGVTPEEYATNKRLVAAGQKAFNTLATRNVMLKSFASNAIANIEQAEKEIDKLLLSGRPIANKIRVAWSDHIKTEPELDRMRQLLTIIAKEVANITSNPNMVGVTHNEAMQEAIKTISVEKGAAGVKKILDLYKTEIGNRLNNAYKTGEDELEGLKKLYPGKTIKFKPLTVTGKETLQPFPADRTKRVVNQSYVTPRGEVVIWDGTGPVRVK